MTTKIAISLPDAQVDAARRAVADGRASSVSGFIAEAIDRFLDGDVYAALLTSMRAAGGEASVDDQKWARETLGLG